VIQLLVLARFVPQGQLDAVPQSQFVVDQAQIILDYMFGCAQRIGDLPVLAALSDTLND
jgi:hypothetical protein